MKGYQVVRMIAPKRVVRDCIHCVMDMTYHAQFIQGEVQVASHISFDEASRLAESLDQVEDVMQS